jgi:unsaturated rhamnogalacturonyl hydrolase
VNPGRLLFELLGRGDDGRYRAALAQLHGQLSGQPRTPEGGFWHKGIYPGQMWLDGLYMAAPFRARYAKEFGGPELFDDIVAQFELIEDRARDPATGLLHHAWDSGPTMAWADPSTGRSPQIWGRAMGWFAMALVDSWEYLPEGHRGRASLAAMLLRLGQALLRVRDPGTGLFWQVLDQGGRAGNYLEASASSMFSYALARGSRLGLLPAEPWSGLAGGILEAATGRFISQGADGRLHLEESCAVAGLGGKPYRDGSFAYYVGEPRRTDDFKGAGPFILASIEYERRRDRA